MSDDNRKDDAADKAPRPVTQDKTSPKPAKQDAPNYDDAEDGGRSLPLDDINSANDE